MSTDSARKEYIFASDFDQTLTFNDSGYVLAELVGIPTDEFERKSTGMARLNLVQQARNLRTYCFTIRSSKPKSARSICTKSASAFA